MSGALSSHSYEKSDTTARGCRGCWWEDLQALGLYVNKTADTRVPARSRRFDF